VCSNTGKGTNLSSVMYKDGDNYKFVQNVTKNGESAFFEAHLLNSYYNRLCEPKLIIESVIHKSDLIYPNHKIDNY
jgi:hypothetical protein